MPSTQPTEDALSRRFHDLLSRAWRIRRLIEEEQRRPQPNTLHLIRLKGLALRLKTRLNALTGRRLVALASAPRFQPRLVAVPAPIRQVHDLHRFRQ